MKKRIGVEGFREIERWLRREAQPLSVVGLIQAACLDGTDIPAWSSRDPHDTRRGRGDPDARVGRCKSGAFDAEAFPYLGIVGWAPVCRIRRHVLGRVLFVAAWRGL